MDSNKWAQNGDGTAVLPEGHEARPREVIGRLLAPRTTPVAARREGEVLRLGPPPIACFCFEAPDSFLGKHVRQVVAELARRGQEVHLFSRHPFDLGANVRDCPVGMTLDGDVTEQVQEFTRRAGNAFLERFPGDGGDVRLLGYEWSAVPVLSLIRGLRNLDFVLSLHSLERQRSDLAGEVARKIEAVEHTGLREARVLLMHDAATGEVARQQVPEAAERATQARALFPVWNFETGLDPGAVKARYGIGPLDPMVLFVGDLSERYGPDLLVKAMPTALRNHREARAVVVGDGSLFWPLRVYARYLLLEHAVRLLGHLQGQPLHELIEAADVVVVPSREPTPWWPIQAAWAARRPVVASHEAAKSLLEHEKDAVLVYPSENSLVWGLERVLNDGELRATLGRNGRAKLDERLGWPSLAAQVEELLDVCCAAR
jgi:glycosyltransferase involved in cell wall biosynthesis